MTGSGRPLNFYALLATVMVAPLPLGSVYQWSWAGIAVLVGLLWAFWALKVVRRRLAFDPRPLWIPAAVYLLALVWVAVQASNWTPEAWHHPIWRQAATILSSPYQGSISVAPYKTVSGLLQLTSYGAIFFLAAQYGRDQRLARQALWAMAIVGSFYALYGLYIELTGLQKVLWFDKTAYLKSLTSTFVNRNMYAYYGGIGLLCAGGLLMDHLFRGAPSSGRALRLFEAIKLAPTQVALLGLIVVVLVLAVAFTESRGGALSATTALACLFFLLGRDYAPKGPWSWLWLAIGCLAFWVLIYSVTGAHLRDRYDSQFFESIDRLTGYAITLTAIAAAPLQGYGYGTFQEVFYLFNDGSHWGNFNYSHQLYLGGAVALGLPVALCLLGAVAWVSAACVRGLRRRNRLLPALGVALTLQTAMHGMVDSPLYPPANAVTFAFLVGLAFAQSAQSREGKRRQGAHPGGVAPST